MITLINKKTTYKQGIQLKKSNQETIKEIFEICLKHKTSFKIESNSNVYISPDKIFWEEVFNDDWILVSETIE